VPLCEVRFALCGAQVKSELAPCAAWFKSPPAPCTSSSNATSHPMPNHQPRYWPMDGRCRCGAVASLTTKSRSRRSHFEAAVKKFASRLRGEHEAHADRYENYKLALVDLMDNSSDGIVDQALEEDFDGSPMPGEGGHATRYYAVVIKHDLYKSAGPANFQQLKAEARQ
jgi:hypothetical protein